MREKPSQLLFLPKGSKGVSVRHRSPVKWQEGKQTRASGKQTRTDTLQPGFSLGSLLFVSQDFLNMSHPRPDMMGI